MYKEMAKVAHQEGFHDIANRMEGVAKIESIHERRYRDLLEAVQKKTVFKRSKAVT
jgi:rubrerythrin